MAYASSSRRWQIVGLLMALCFISHLNRVSMSVAADERIMKQYGISPTQMGMVYSAFLLVYTLCMLPGGIFIDRVGPRVALMVMGFGSAFFGALTGLLGLASVGVAQMLPALLVVRSLMGLLTTPLHPACARVVADWVPPTRVSSANGLVTCAAILGVASTYKIFGALIDRFDWPWAFLLAAAATVLLTGLWAVCGADWPKRIEETEPSEGGPVQEGVGKRGKSPAAPCRHPRLRLTRELVLLTLSYAAIGYFQYLFFYWMHYYFKNVLQLGAERSRSYAGLPMLALAVGMVLGGWLADRAQRRFAGRLGRALVPGVGMLLGTTFLLCGVAVQEPLWIVGFFTLSMGAVGTSESSFWQTAVELGGRRGGTAAAVVNTGGNGMGLLAPLLTPAISEQLGWHWGITVGGLVCFLGALCWWGIDPSPREAHSRALQTISHEPN